MLYEPVLLAAKVKGGVKTPEKLEERNRMIPVYPIVVARITIKFQ
jgi:hypothetical protein